MFAINADQKTHVQGVGKFAAPGTASDEVQSYSVHKGVGCRSVVNSLTIVLILNTKQKFLIVIPKAQNAFLLTNDLTPSRVSWTRLNHIQLD